MIGIKQSRGTWQTRAYIILRASAAPRDDPRAPIQVHRSCIRMPNDELTNLFVIYESIIRTSLRPGAPTTTYFNQISFLILSDNKTFVANEIRKMAAKAFNWSQIFVVFKNKTHLDWSSQPKWWWWWWNLKNQKESKN